MAKIAELFDRQISQLIPAGGHPWKHVAGAAAVICYAVAVGRRSRVKPIAEPDYRGDDGRSSFAGV